MQEPPKKAAVSNPALNKVFVCLCQIPNVPAGLRDTLVLNVGLNHKPDNDSSEEKKKGSRGVEP